MIATTYAMINVYRDNRAEPPSAITLDIDGTFDGTHGVQQLAVWNGF